MRTGPLMNKSQLDTFYGAVALSSRLMPLTFCPLNYSKISKRCSILTLGSFDPVFPDSKNEPSLKIRIFWTRFDLS